MSLFTSSLKALGEFGALAIDLPQHVPKSSEMRKVAQMVADQFNLASRPTAEELLRALKIFQRWLAGEVAPSKSDWELAPWVCLQGSPRLMTSANFATELAARIAAESQPRLLRPLVHSYLLDYQPECKATALVGSVIASGLARHQSPWAKTWRKCAENVDLFAADGVSARLTDYVFERESEVGSVLRELGFSSELVTHSGLHAPIGNIMPQRLQQLLQSRPDVPANTVRNGLTFLRTGSELKFPADRVEIAEALLAPFAVKDLRNLPARAELSAFFLDVYGDPRSVGRKWAGVSKDARRTITRWLVRDSLDLFFDILSATADPIWRWRRAFWLALERHNVIEEAWPVFGRDARAYVKNHAAKGKGIVSSGVLTGAMYNQSVMLMRVGQYIVAEWSHSGSVRVWAADDPRAPSMNRGSYEATEIRTDCLYDQRHDGTDRYSWQISLADWLAKRVGVRIGVSDMRPS